MRQLFVFVNNSHARLAGFRLTPEGYKHERLPDAVGYNLNIHQPEHLHGVCFDQVVVDSAVARSFKKTWSETRARIMAIVMCPGMVWIEPS